MVYNNCLSAECLLRFKIQCIFCIECLIYGWFWDRSSDGRIEVIIPVSPKGPHGYFTFPEGPFPSSGQGPPDRVLQTLFKCVSHIIPWGSLPAGCFLLFYNMFLFLYYEFIILSLTRSSRSYRLNLTFISVHLICTMVLILYVFYYEY